MNDFGIIWLTVAPLIFLVLNFTFGWASNIDADIDEFSSIFLSIILAAFWPIVLCFMILYALAVGPYHLGKYLFRKK